MRRLGRAIRKQDIASKLGDRPALPVVLAGTPRELCLHHGFQALPSRYNAAMRQALRLHPDSLCSAATQVEVDVARPRAGGLVLSYFVTGRIGDLRLPPVVAAARTEELWRHTC